MATNLAVGDYRRELVTRVIESPRFKKCPRLREFLLYAAERAIQNRPQDLHEQQIGWKVFGRREDYNCSDDNIVRVEARQLRKRLEEYFASDGGAEPVVIVIPKGSYVPIFSPRGRAPVTAASVVAPAPVAALPETRELARWSWAWIQPTLIVLLALTCLWFWNRDRSLQRLSKSPVSPVTERNVLWSTLFDGEEETTIVCGDSTLVLYEDITRQSVSLSDYVSEAYSSGLSNLELGRGSTISLFTKQYTSIADVHLVEKMLQLNRAYWSRTRVRSARNMQLRDFKSGNFVLFGSKRADPWDELFESRLNFHFEIDETRHVPVIRNQSPQAGEQTEYVNVNSGKPGDAYSFVAFLPNLSYTGHVLILAGTTMEATEAAGEYMINPEFSSRLLNRLGFQPGSKLGSFEVLLKSSTLAGSSRNSEIVAYRTLREADTTASPASHIEKP